MPTSKELSEIREAYLLKRETILISRVNALGVKMYDKIFEQYLANLEVVDGKVIYSKKNIALTKGLDKIYNQFNKESNIPLIKKVLKDYDGIIPLNESYFENIAKKGVVAESKIVKEVVNKALGLDSGKPIKDGFTYKFINDKRLLKTIKKETTKTITKGQGFQVFRENLKKLIQGTKGIPNSGGLHQYYRNYAYDTYQKIDRLNQDTFANELGLRYFIWAGGLIVTSRPLCKLCNSKIIDSTEFKKMKYSQLKLSLRDGLNESWVPMLDLGQFGCRHTKNYITDFTANQLKNRWLDVSKLKN